MATKFVSEDGSYDQSPKDGNTQASNKFSNPSHKPTMNHDRGPSDKGQSPTPAQKRR